MSLLPEDLLVRLGNELTNLAADGAVPDFVRAEDPVEARRQWARLVAIVVVMSEDDLIDLASVTWLCHHRTETTAALHSIRLHDWTMARRVTLGMSNLVLTSTLPVQQGQVGSVGPASTPTHASTPARPLDLRVAEAGHLRSRTVDSRPPTRPDAQQPKLRLMTQNVQGLAKNWATVLAWFDGFRRKHDGGRFDIVLLQETRATARWAEQLEDLYARAWGYDPRHLKAPLSYWPATPTAAAGVAVLLAPDSVFSSVTPWQQSRWSQYFVAVQGTFDGEPVTVICVYAPIRKASRELLFQTLATVDPPSGLVLVGGDFNCVLDAEHDRSRRTKRSHGSDGLSSLLDAWGLADAVTDDLLATKSPADVAAFHAAYHTYMYQLRDDAVATARLDRWYVSIAGYGQVGSVTTAPPVARSDHDSVALQVHTREPAHASAGRSPPQLRYPLPVCAVDAILMCGHDALLVRGVPLSQIDDAAAAAEGWDVLKTDIRRESLLVRRRCLAAASARYRARIRRLHRALRDAKKAIHLRTAHFVPTVASVTVGLSALALDPASRYKSIRRSLISLQEAGAARTGRARRALHAGRPHESSGALFKRISAKFCRRRTRSLPVEPGSRLGPADRVARDWLPIIQRPALDGEIQDRLFASLPPRVAAVDLTTMDEPISTAEVAAAIKACPRGKACGPDGLSNDWYRDHVDELALVLAPLFTKWHAAGVLPPSFSAASVVCIPKKSHPETGLDFRPIALLNTDYKLYSRILLNRIRTQVPRLVANTQYGFVPGRQVHDAIDVWSALQLNAATGRAPSSSMAVLLDFAKAYDSLDRRFLSLALRRHGFSDALVSAVEAMHLGTTAAFLADGQTSVTMEVWTGIRQGCPLAPTLFILAVDVLYEMIAGEARLPGVALDGDERVSIVGFADDTTAYLNSPDEVPALRQTLATFAAASGLRVNEAKSMALCLTASGRTEEHEQMGFPVAAATQLVRYLGSQISSTPSGPQVWDVLLQQLRARLALAELKTTDLLQRIQICQAVILPKMLFVARHAWPTAPVLKRLQRFMHRYAWHGTLSEDPIARRAWASADVSTLGRSEGGLQLPDVRTELLVLSGLTVQRWLAATDLVAAAAGRVLARGRAARVLDHVTPGRSPQPAPRLGSTLSATGHSVLRSAACVPREDDEIEVLRPILAVAGRAPLSRGEWRHGWYRRDYGQHHEALATLARLHRTKHGRLNMACLLATPAVGHNLLLHSSGRAIVASDFPGLHCDKSIGDLLDIQWESTHVLRFRLKGAQYPYSAVADFRRLCDTVVMCYPELLRPQDPPTHIHERTKSSDIWFTRSVDGGTHLIRDVGPHEQADLGKVTSLRHAEALARRATGKTRLQFVPHPSLCTVLPLWGPADRFSRKHLRRHVATTHHTRATTELERRTDAALAISADFGAALASVGWSEVHKLRHSSSRQRLLFYKVKGLRLSGWDALHERRGCPHCEAIGSDGGSTFHIVWDCPSAQRLWRAVRSWWASLGLWSGSSSADDRDFLTAVFSLRLPRTPAKVWDLVSLSQRSPVQSDAHGGPYPALQAAWQQIVLETLVVIPSWRNGRSDPERSWTPAMATVVHDASCQRVLDTLAHRCSLDAALPSFHALLVREIRALFANPDPVIPPPPAHAQAVHVLFFDGGSRGNPGPGGSGACVVRVGALSGCAEIVWSAAMSSAHPTTTNNQAEYGGLLAGLRAARQHRWTALEVVGDSALILRQLRDYRPPRNRRLLRLYSEARRLGDQLDVRNWTHHVRANNRMADALANLAMDAKTSSQVTHPTTRPGNRDLHVHLGNDLRPWLPIHLGRRVELSF